MSKPQQIKQRMSKAIASSSSIQTSSNSSTLNSKDTVQANPTKNAFSSAVPRQTYSSASSTWQAPQHWNVNAPATISPAKMYSTAKNRTSEEQEISEKTAARFASRLAEDQNIAINPDVDSPFVDSIDVIKRLLPYHIFQQPQADLEFIKQKGKGKQSEASVRAEIEETKFALSCHRRREALRKRLRNARIREGRQTSPDDQAYTLAQAALEAERTETAWLNSELRAARSELEKLERERRLTTPRPPPPAPPPQTQYYRAYPYSYTQPYGTAMQSSTSTFAVTPAPPQQSYVPYQPSGAIPVQFPVASLPALNALGIVPVPVAALPPDGQPQPPAVLRGSTANGTMLSLEINVSLLQTAQMNGLALVLNTLMSRGSTGVPQQQTPPVATQHANSVSNTAGSGP